MFGRKKIINYIIDIISLYNNFYTIFFLEFKHLYSYLTFLFPYFSLSLNLVMIQNLDTPQIFNV